MRFVKTIFIGLCILGIHTAFGQLATDNPLQTPLDSLVQQEALSYFNAPCRVGLAIGVTRHGKAHYYNYGTVSKTAPQLPTPASVFEIASLTKTFTGTLLAKAVQEGKMKMDDDIRKYLPGSYPNLEYKGKFITLRHLITHQSGLPNSIPDNSDLFEKPNFDSLPFLLVAREKDYDKKRYLEELHQVILDTVPGSVYFKYSNIGVKLIGFALEEVYKEPFDSLVSKYITQPLGMTATRMIITNDSLNEVKGYGPGGGLMPATLPNAGAAGGLQSNVQDMMHYAQFHLNEKDPVVRTAHALLEGDAAKYARAMGWSVQLTKEGYRKVQQSGGTYGMSSQMVLFPNDDTGFVLLVNEGCMDSQGQLEKLALALYNGMRRMH